jgi:hypothetical protein
VKAGIAFTFTITVLDAYGNVATGYTGTIHFSSSDPLALLPANYTFTSGTGKDNGVHRFSATFKTTGTQSLTATDTVTSSITGKDSGITVAAASVEGFYLNLLADPENPEAFFDLLEEQQLKAEPDLIARLVESFGTGSEQAEHQRLDIAEAMLTDPQLAASPSGVAAALITAGLLGYDLLPKNKGSSPNQANPPRHLLASWPDL